MDRIVGRIVTRLDELGLRENTLLIFTSDNGTNKSIRSMMGEREVRGGKSRSIDAGIHVPDETREKCIDYVQKSQNDNGSFRYQLRGGHSTFAMTAAGGALAVGVYHWLGLKFLRQGWFNLDIVWALSLVAVGGIALATVH